MKVQTTTTHFVIRATAGELKAFDKLGWLMYISEDSVWWARRGGGTPLMDPGDFAWYATGRWLLHDLEEQTCLEVSYPRITLGLDLDRTTLEQFEDGMTVDVGGERYLLRVQRQGCPEKVLLDIGCMPTDTFVNCDQVYALQLRT